MKVRFAPSPTGFLHIGNARTAIINHLVAKKNNAQFVLRIEDTDMERSSKESEESIINDLKWLGIEWTEGSDVQGDCGPYRQSERFDIYNEYTQKLLSEKKAYKCFCTSDELEEIRTQQQKKESNSMYDGRCKNLSQEVQQKYIDEGRKFTVRFSVPENEIVEIDDGIMGKVTFNSDNIGGDFIIVRSDGVPVYNYIVVIDDSLMKVTDVIRGEDHLSNTPKQILISKAIGFDAPKYAHMPLVMGEDRKKLSKRHGITSVQLYRSQGYLPEALVNYIAMLGWASESGEEILEIDNIIKEFDINKIAKNAAIFDFKKLKWMNGNYIRNFDEDRIVDLFVPFIKEAGYDIDSIESDELKNIILFCRNYCELLSDIGNVINIFLDDVPEMDDEVTQMFESEIGQSILKGSIDAAKNLKEDEFAESFVNHVKEISGQKGKNLFMPCRAVLTSRLHGPDLVDTMKLLGYEKCVSRIKTVAEKFLK